MLSDRSYMRDEYSSRSAGVLPWMIAILIAGFVIQVVFGRLLNVTSFTEILTLTPAGLRNGFVWTLVTYAVLHGGIFHLFINGLILFLIGREVAPLLGNKRFVAVCIANAILGGLLWFATNFNGGNVGLVGASAVVMGLFTIFALFYPERQITFLLFFVLPVTVKPRIALWVLLGFEVLGFLSSELPPGGGFSNIAHSAHLGGMLAGWIYFKFFHARHGWDRASGFSIEMPSWLRRRKKSETPTYSVNVTPPEKKDLRAEVDRILDKINSKGFGSLSDEEKRILDQAKDLLSRR